MSILGLLVAILILCLIWWSVNSLLGAFGVPPQIATVIRVLFVILVVLWLLSAFGLIGGPVLRVR